MLGCTINFSKHNKLNKNTARNRPLPNPPPRGENPFSMKWNRPFLVWVGSPPWEGLGEV
jgi:hypothetical protein